jgi:hypothetical protein
LLAVAAWAGPGEDFASTVAPFVRENCLLCHAARPAMAGLDLERYLAPERALQAVEVWEKVLAKLKSGEMPPKGRPRPAPEAMARVTRWIEARLTAEWPATRPDPGRVTARRLNRAEYNNTVRDLLGVDLRPADDFPTDDSGYGFDTIADVLSVSPVHLERYLAAAEKLAAAAIVVDRPPPVTQERYQIEPAPAPTGELVWPEEYSVRHRFPVTGDYEILFALGGRRPGPLERLRLMLWVDGEPLANYELEPETSRRRFEHRVRLKEGEHALRAALVPDTSRVDDALGEHPGPNTREVNLVLDRFEIRGPYHPERRPLTDSHRRIIACGHAPGEHEAGCARLILSRLARRAWRRPVTPEEVASLERFVRLREQEGASLEEGLQAALEAILVSPKFLFRIERDPAPGEVRRLDDFELASRLSYFLWSSMPDEELFALAEQGRLSEPEVLEAQARRMIADPRARALVENFGGQWLQLRNLAAARPDPARFPDFDEELRQAMRTETELFFEEVLRRDRSILDFIDGRYTYLNERLARHYGIEGVKGPHFRRVELDGVQRSGVLTQASVLTVASYPTRTSPVLRGLWVLENVLGAPPPPPPANVPALDDSRVGSAATLRQQLERHRADPGCAVCHNRIDPLGFGLENYGPTGAWRTHEGRFPVDAAGELPGGRKFQTPAELKQILREDAPAFARTLTEKLLIYALGRGLARGDRPVIEAIREAVARDAYRFSTLILEIVKSPPFRMRRAEVEATQGD